VYGLPSLRRSNLAIQAPGLLGERPPEHLRQARLLRATIWLAVSGFHRGRWSRDRKPRVHGLPSIRSSVRDRAPGLWVD